MQERDKKRSEALQQATNLWHRCHLSAVNVVLENKERKALMKIEHARSPQPCTIYSHSANITKRKQKYYQIQNFAEDFEEYVQKLTRCVHMGLHSQQTYRLHRPK